MATLRQHPTPALDPGRDESPEPRRARDVGTARDPRWVLDPRTMLTPSIVYRLMAGRWAESGIRLKGWVDAVQLGRDEARVLEAVWVREGDRLRAEAGVYGFEPSGATKRRSTGAGFEQWRATFLAAHQY